MNRLSKCNNFNNHLSVTMIDGYYISMDIINSINLKKLY